MGAAATAAAAVAVAAAAVAMAAAAHLSQAGSLNSALVLVEVQNSVIPGQAAMVQHVPSGGL